MRKTGADPTLKKWPWFPSVEARAEWLFRLMRAELSTMTDGEWLDLLAQAGEFVGGVVRTDDADIDPGQLPRRLRPTRDAIIRLQAMIREGWERLHAGNWWTLEDGIVLGLRRTGSHLVRGYQEGRFRDLFLADALTTIEQTWDRLNTCRRCGAVFVKRHRQAYCSPGCSQTERLKRFRANHPPRDYRRERERATRKRLGPNIRLGRKRRSGNK